MLKNEPTEHGGQLDQLAAHFPDAPRPWVDLSTGISPWAYPYSLPNLNPRLESVLDMENRLPTQQDFLECETAMANAFGTRAENVLAVAGIEPVIRLMPYLLPGNLHIQAPTYGDYALSWKLAGRKNLDNTDGRADDPHVKVICQPNNPDGQSFSLHQLTDFHRSLQANNSWLVIDEAYIDASTALTSVTKSIPPNLVVLKSFGKFFGMPGLRLGAVLAEESFLLQLKNLLGEWRVGTRALHIGSQAYRDETWQSLQKVRLHKRMEAQLHLMKKLDFKVIGHTDLFLTLHREDAVGLWQHLMRQGIYTRAFNKHNLLRIGLAANERDLKRLETALRLYRERDACN